MFEIGNGKYLGCCSTEGGPGVIASVTIVVCFQYNCIELNDLPQSDQWRGYLGKINDT